MVVLQVLSKVFDCPFENFDGDRRQIRKTHGRDGHVAGEFAGKLQRVLLQTGSENLQLSPGGGVILRREGNLRDQDSGGKFAQRLLQSLFDIGLQIFKLVGASCGLHQQKRCVCISKAFRGA